jgi:hypothetical protein
VGALFARVALDDGAPPARGHEGQRRLEQLGGAPLAPGLGAQQAIDGL